MSKKINTSISFQLNPIVPTTKKSFISEIYYNSKLEEKISSIEPNSYVDLSYWNLIDHDMPIITRQIIINKQCTELYLCGNKITSQGALILALKLSNNSTLKSLDLSYNYITDAGVHSISQILVPNHYSSLKILILNKNGISNDGVRYLSEMLETNQTLTELWLSDNEIGNEGVKQLSNVLNYYNRTLKVLILSFNIFITDLSIDYLLQIFERNQTLKKLSINNCNLSETGKMKLQEIANRKKKIEIEI
jgi:Ran GTPase-activating protein (RanGAP) involved in mRNA processing and transport